MVWEWFQKRKYHYRGKKFAADNKPSYLCNVKTLETATGVETEDNKWREPKRKTT